MGAGDNAAPVIIKRKKVVAGGGHHGGAWKVAYADFVTAMMAFFLLMWLLNATTEKQRKGISDYFNPTIPVNRISGGGDGALGGDSLFTQDALSRSGAGGSVVPEGEGTAAADPSAGSAGAEAAAAAERRALEEVAAALQGIGGESLVTPNLPRHVLTRLTDEGLVVEFFDTDTDPLFAEGGDQPEPVMVALAGAAARAFRLVTNGVAVQGHIRAQPEVLRVDPSWDLSARRAMRLRLLLEEAGLPPRRIERVTGLADRRPADPNPMATRNSRVELILLRSDPAGGR
ncbi:flagellar motor protein MotB [Frigidibacter oleivorans]|uniref:flagellar motor protein MotB n=1 Tax=Frigidibacter oleivorans TaxID=2487129 RepID=UPI000F8D49B5|nr:flagellar motor protein MotB [Frigidibacter oleivorans]